MFRFVHAADLHLDSPLRGLDLKESAPRAVIREAPRRALDALVRLCLDEEVDFLLLAGDIYDGDWKDFATGQYFRQQMRRLGDTQVILIRGNHDAANKMTRTLPLPKNVRVLAGTAAETHRIDSIRVAIHGRSFQDRETRENLVREYPPPIAGWFNIGLLHTSLAGAGTAHDTYAPCSEEQLVNKEYHYWALGHIHQRRVVCAAAPAIVFPGNIQGRHIREDGPKGAYLVAVDDDGGVDLQFRRLDVVRWEAIDCAADPNHDRDKVLEAAVGAVRELVASEEDRLIVVRYRITGPSHAHMVLQARSGEATEGLRELLRDEYGERVWLESVRFDTTPPVRATAELDDATAELNAVIEEFASDPQHLMAVAETLTALQDKLPAPLRNGDEPMNLTDPEWLKQLLGRVLPVLADAGSPGDRP